MALQYDLEQLLEELSQQCLAMKRGLAEKQRTGAIYASHPVATDLESILSVREFWQKEPDPDIREQAARVYYSAVAQFIRMDLLLRDEALAQFMMEAGVRVNGRSVTLAEMQGWLLAEDDHDTRESLLVASRPLVEKASIMKAAIWEGAASILQEDFGYRDHLHFYEEKKGLEVFPLAQECLGLLLKTDQTYEQRLLPWAEATLGKEASSVSHLHMMRLLQLDPSPSGMALGGVLPVVEKMSEVLGFSEALRSRIRLDQEPRPGKSPLSRCVPLKVPQEIHVVLRSLGTLADMEAALHELGHAFQLAHAQPSLPYPYRHLPRSYALSECFGFLMEGLIREPEFLTRHTGLSRQEAERVCSWNDSKRLYVVRRYAGKLLFAQEFLSKGDWLDWSAYPRWLARATGFSHEPQEALMDLEEELYCADYLKAWAGETVLRRHLKEMFGPLWFESRRAGDYLKGLWAEGEKWDLEELVEYVGRGPLGLDPLVDELLCEL